MYLVGLYIYYKMIHGPYNIKHIILFDCCIHGSHLWAGITSKINYLRFQISSAFIFNTNSLTDGCCWRDGLYVCEVDLFWKDKQLSWVKSTIFDESVVHNCDADMKLQAYDLCKTVYKRTKMALSIFRYIFRHWRSLIFVTANVLSCNVNTRGNMLHKKVFNVNRDRIMLYVCGNT